MNARELILITGAAVLKNEKRQFDLDDPFREKTYREIYTYFLDDRNGTRNGRLNPDKCLALIGNLGVGKSIVLKVMQRIFRSFHRIEALQLKRLVQENGALQTLKDYGYDFKKDLLIDELGLEDPTMKIWGNEPNIFADLFMERHNLFLETGIKTHIITNHTTDELENLYGERVLDRLLGDTEGNLIVWEGETLRFEK